MSVTYVMKIGEWDKEYSDASNFSFPRNPVSFSIPFETDTKVDNVPFSSWHIVMSGGGVKTREVVLSGNFRGSSKETDFNSLTGHIHDNDLKRLWLNSESFYYVKGLNIRPSWSGEKVNFIDYACVFGCVSPYLMKTKRNDNFNISNSAAKASNNLVNNGNASAYPIISIKNNDGGSTVSSVSVSDGIRSVTWTSNLLANETLVLYPFYFYESSSGVKDLRIGHALVDGVFGTKASVPAYEFPRIEAGSSTDTFSVTCVDASDVTVNIDWHDSYTS